MPGIWPNNIGPPGHLVWLSSVIPWWCHSGFHMELFR